MYCLKTRLQLQSQQLLCGNVHSTHTHTQYCVYFETAICERNKSSKMRARRRHKLVSPSIRRSSNSAASVCVCVSDKHAHALALTRAAFSFMCAGLAQRCARKQQSSARAASAQHLPAMIAPPPRTVFALKCTHLCDGRLHRAQLEHIVGPLDARRRQRGAHGERGQHDGHHQNGLTAHLLVGSASGFGDGWAFWGWWLKFNLHLLNLQEQTK